MYKSSLAKLFLKLYKLLLIILGFCTIYCFVVSIFGEKAVYDYNSFFLIIGVFVYVSIVGIVYYQCKRFTDKQLNCMIIVMLAMYLMLTLLFGLRIKSARPYDLFNLHNAAISYMQEGRFDNIDYFSVFPMQLSYTYLLILVYKIGSLVGITDYRTSGTLFGVALLFLSAFLVYKIAEKIKDKQLGAVALFVFVTNPVFWIYSSYYYSDLPGMAFLLLSVYIALCAYVQKRQGVSLLFCVLLGVVTFLGYKMRATVAIAGIAVVALGIVKFNDSREKTEKIDLVKKFIAFIAGGIIAGVGYGILERLLSVELNQDMKLPIICWIMTGLGDENSGTWSAALRKYADSFPTYDERLVGCTEMVKTSLTEMGIMGFIDLLFRKLEIMWSDGMTALTTNFGTATHYGPLYEYTIGNKNAITCYGTQIMRSSVLFCTIPLIFSELKNKFSRRSLLLITFFGYMLFYFFWEVGQKYALMFVPLLIIMGVLGIHNMIERLGTFQKVVITGNTEYWLDKDRLRGIFKKISKSVIFVTVLFAVFSWNDMVVKTDTKYNFIVFQSSIMNNIQVESDAVRQSFLTKRKFDAVYVRFLNDNVPQDQQYVFSLFNDNNVCIYQEIFSAKNIGDNVYHAFVFDEVEVNGYHEFYFEIAAMSEYESTLAICNAGNKYADYYTRGECTVLNENKGDMTFRVYDIEKAGYYSKKFYIIMIGMVLLLESAIYMFIHTKQDKRQ